MVFPGRFSTGCLQCRQRKVKCDETKPTCRRCYMYGKPCPGYTDQFQFRHKIPGPKKEISVSEAKPSASSPTAAGITHASPEHDPEGDASPSETSTYVSSPTIARSYESRSVHRNPGPSHEHIALCYFIRRFISPSNADSLPGHLTFLPDLFNHQHDGILEVATACVAQVAAYNRFGQRSFLVMSYRSYGRALQMLQQTIQSDDEISDDRVISAVLLLCIFKDISGEGLGDPNEHASGLYHLIQKRGIEQLVSRNGFELFMIALVRLNVYSFLHNDDNYLDPAGLSTLLAPFCPLMHAMAIVCSTLRLRHALSKSTACYKASNQWQTSESTDTNPAALEPDADLVQSAFELLEEFDSWDTEAATYWEATLQGRTLPLALRAHTFLEPEIACILVLVRSARLVHLLTLLEYLECYRRQQLGADGMYAATEGFQAWTECVHTLGQLVRDTIDDMLLCVPYALGDVDSNGHPASMTYDGAGALIIVHPIRLISYCSYATAEQAETCKAVLDRINNTIGIRAAVTWEADVVSWPQLCGCQCMLSPTVDPVTVEPMEIEPYLETPVGSTDYFHTMVPWAEMPSSG